MFNALLLASGVLWTAAYLLIIRQGQRDRVYGMPLAALCANLSWEFIFAVLYPHDLPQRAVNGVWLAFDLAIAAQVLRFGPREWGLRPWQFGMVFLLALATAFGGVLLVTIEFQNFSGSYAAFGQNLMMSVLFVSMRMRRKSCAGQSLAIAVCKLLGTLLASIAFYTLTKEGRHSPLLHYLFVTIFVFDAVSVAMVRADRHGRAETLAEPHATDAGDPPGLRG